MEHLTFSRLGRGPGHALDARPRSLFTSSGRDGDVRVPPDTAWEEVERKVGPDEGLMSRLSCPGQHHFILVISENCASLGAPDAHSRRGAPGQRLSLEITVLDSWPGPLTSTTPGTFVTEWMTLDLVNCHRN